MASCMLGITVVNGYRPSSQWKWSKCAVTARLIICQFSIMLEYDPLILLRLSLRPTLASLKLVIIIPSQILLGIPQTRFRLSGSQEWPSMGSNLYHEDSNISDSVPCIRYLRDTHSSLFACRTEVFVRHAFISENDDERHIIITFIMFLGANGYLRIGISLNWIEK